MKRSIPFLMCLFASLLIIQSSFAVSVDRYKERKAKGLVRVEKIGDSLLFVEKQFDQTTGEPENEKIDRIDIAQMKQARESLMDKVKQFDEMIKDAEKVQNPQ